MYFSKILIFASLFNKMGNKQFVIQFGGLSVGTHDYEFEVTNTFFESFEYSEVHKANIKVKLEVVKQNNLLTLNFEIGGTIGVDCDRCLAEFDIPVSSKQSLVVKHGDVEETNDDIVVLSHGATEVNISQPLYEFINLAIPVRKVPCEISKKYKCDTETLNRLNNISIDENPEEENNPLWDKLKNINFNNN